VPEVSEQHGEIDGLPVCWRSAEPPDGTAAVPTLYVHGVPNGSVEWTRFLERTGGLAPDLPGFGKSGKPGYLNYTMEEYDRFLERFLDEREVERVKLVVHDWGAVALLTAQRLPERIERVAIINAVPLLSGYRWHRTARIWRTPVLGELAMGTTNRFTMRFLTRESNVTPGPLPEEWQQDLFESFDGGTQRAILRLYRSSPPERLAAAGTKLGELSGRPALVLWGTQDPYIPERFGREYAQALGATLQEYPDAGHWAWLDRPDLIDRLAEFLTEG
jgi:pimeloyl-ACP methyl ester carboxylesterase